MLLCFCCPGANRVRPVAMANWFAGEFSASVDRCSAASSFTSGNPALSNAQAAKWLSIPDHWRPGVVGGYRGGMGKPLSACAGIRADRRGACNLGLVVRIVQGEPSKRGSRGCALAPSHRQDSDEGEIPLQRAMPA